MKHVSLLSPLPLVDNLHYSIVHNFLPYLLLFLFFFSFFFYVKLSYIIELITEIYIFEGRRARKDSLSPDSASYPRRRDSKSHLSPERAVDKRDISPIRERSQLTRQSMSMAGRSPPRYLHFIDLRGVVNGW